MLNTPQYSTGTETYGLIHMGTTTSDTGIATEILEKWQRNIGTVQALMIFSSAAGGYVQVESKHHFAPVLIGSDNRPVYLFRFVEILDEQVDYDKVKKELPSLSYAQIGGAIAFLKQVSQANIWGVDVEEAEEQADLEHGGLLDELHRGLADQETARVLYHDQHNG